MNYSISKVSTAEGCNALINLAEEFLQGLYFRKSDQEREHNMMNKVDCIAETNKTDINAEIVAYETTLEGMPEDIIVDDMYDELEELQWKLLLMESDRQGYGVLAIIQVEFTIACLERQIIETMAYINALMRRKEEL